MPHLLLVDDDPEALEWLTELAKGEGFTVSQADSLRAARIHMSRLQPDVLLTDLQLPDGQGIELATEDRFFSYKHYLDGNGELIDPMIMMIIAKAMIRNKPDSYCQAHDLETRGISDLVADLINLYSLYGFSPGARPTHLVHRTTSPRKFKVGGGLKRMWQAFLSVFTGKKRG